ncbi:multidrug ABC transporter substrate-binding protein [Flavobacterium psychrophilum]|nr:multidrug ABC transporter substrate-binding protein [Flavobacterium psychrophilum]AOE52632.1 multidrug ABC transporter substrate-binding protein [Flavobacterium psychrophilum]
MLKNWLKIYLYQIKNNKFFTALNVLGLSLGIAGLVFAILYWNDEHSYNQWNPNKDNTFQVINDLGNGNVWATNIAQTGALAKALLPEVADYCYMDDWYHENVVSYNGKGQVVSKIISAQNNFFSFFPFEFVKGSAATSVTPNSVAISEAAAKLLFGDADPMNKTIKFANGGVFSVKGVYRLNQKSSFEPNMVFNGIDSRLKDNKDQWGNYSFGLFLKLKDPAKAKAVEAGIRKIYFENRTKANAKEEGLTPEEYVKKHGETMVYLEALKDIRLHSVAHGSPEGKGNYRFLLIMAGLSVLVLILSIVNYVNLATANAVKRAKEVGVRKILGAGKGNIIRQFIFETILTTLFAILLALVIVELSLPYYNDFLGKELAIHGSQFYVQLIAIFIVVIVMSGIFPAVYVSNFETLNVLKGNFGRSKSGVWLRNGMLILQFAIASFFIVGSYIVYRQIEYLTNKDLGFTGDQVIQVQYRQPNYDWSKRDWTPVMMQRYETVKQEVRKIEGVEEVSAGAFTFGSEASSSSNFSYRETVNVQAKNMAVDFEMLDMLKIKVVKGRNLSPALSSDTINSVLVNETAVRMMGEKDPIGKEIKWNDEKLKIVGVVKDFHFQNINEPIPPMTFFHFKTIDWMFGNVNGITIKVKAENMEQTLAGLEKLWTTKIDTDYPFDYAFVNANFANTYKAYVKQKDLFSLLNVVVILIALFGLFALSSYSIQRRMKEIAIRKTLGADTGVLLLALSKQYVVFCITGFLIAYVPAWMLLDKWLETFAYRIDISILPFIIGFTVLMVLTLAVVLSRAYQATRVDVLTYLKYE